MTGVLEELQEAIAREMLREVKVKADAAEIVKAREQLQLEWMEKEAGVWKKGRLR